MASNIQNGLAGSSRDHTVRQERSGRAEQRRASVTRAQILDAAMTEFAEKGFDGASIRKIADRIGVQHPLITYHFQTKDVLWRATAENAFANIRQEWDGLVPAGMAIPPLERLKAEYRTLFRYTVIFPDFHRFMRQEAKADTPRLRWMTETVMRPLLDRLLPQIVEAQAAGLLPGSDPLLFHYMMISLTATFCDFGNEIRIIGNLSSADTDRFDAYWKMVETVVFSATQTA